MATVLIRHRYYLPDVFIKPKIKQVRPMRDVLAKFSTWTPWTDRAQLTLDTAGIYMLARFDAALLDTNPSLSRNVIYVGETCGQTLAKRLRQFNRSGFLGKSGHSGGVTFASRFKCNSDVPWLYVSIMGTDLNEPTSSAFIRYVERAILWEYVQIYGQYPVCNCK